MGRRPAPTHMGGGRFGMNAGRPKAVVFDMDGVIFDTEPVWLAAETELLSRRGRRFPPELARTIMGVPGAAAMRIVADELGLTDEPAHLSRELNAIFYALVENGLSVMDGLAERLEHLDQLGLPMGVATSTEGALARTMLGRAGLLERFAFVLTRDDVQNGKPDPEIYRKACGMHGVAPSRTVVVEDSLAGTQSARSAGCRVVALRHELTRTLEFPDAELVVDSHRDARVSALLERGDWTRNENA